MAPMPSVRVPGFFMVKMTSNSLEPSGLMRWTLLMVSTVPVTLVMVVGMEMVAVLPTENSCS